MNKINTRKALNPAYRKHKPLRKDVNSFVDSLLSCLKTIKLSEEQNESEEHIKDPIKEFFKNTFYSDYYINTKDRIDLAIYLGKNLKSDVGVIIETKRPSNKNEFLTTKNLNRKALHELLLYYLHERIEEKNNNIKHLIATNGYEWFLFKSDDFYKYFFKNKQLIKEYEAFRDGKKDSTKNELFYNEVAKKYITEIEEKLPFVHLDFTKTNIKDYEDAHLNTLFKIFSDVHILGTSFGNDSNQLNKTFYNELLHIIGLEEIKQKGKKIINRKSEKDRDYGSILEDTIFVLEDRDYLRNIKSIDNSPDKTFQAGLELTLTWINRVLFLKLLESQLLSYHDNQKEYKFLNSEFIKGYDDLNDLFFSALAKRPEERQPKYKERFKYIPYLNSSLFERNELENDAFAISALNDEEIPILNQTVLKDTKGNRLKGKMSTLEYLFRFLDAYDFAADGTEGIEDSHETKTLINASVLGLIFEKINGYKEGSFYTPAYITMYMSRETLRRAVVQKFKEQENKQIENFEDLKAYTNRFFKTEDLKRFNEIVNSIKIIDPAVGSGHFLVSALNELISIKNDLGILIDENGMPLKCDIIIDNDELYVTDKYGHLIDYKPNIKDTTVIQKTLFHEKQNIIENSLFGVDINPNSVKICRLRLWIELLKNAYYTNNSQSDNLSASSNSNSVSHLQTLPNIDINIKQGNSLISRFGLDDDLKSTFKGKDAKYSFEDYKNAVAEYKATNNRERKYEIINIINDVKKKYTETLTRNNPKLKKLNRLKSRFYDLFSSNMVFEPEESYGKKDIEKERKKEEKRMEKEIDKLEEEINNLKSDNIFKNAFEWRFEFPEVLDENGNYIGFDVVIGNPPYGMFNKRQNKTIALKTDKSAIELYKEKYPEATGGVINAARIFYAFGIKISSKKGFQCMIIPFGILTDTTSSKLRKFIFKNHSLIKVEAFPERDNIKRRVFEDVKMSTAILLTSSIKKNTVFDIGISYKREIASERAYFNLSDLVSLNPELAQIPLINEKSFELLKKIYTNTKTIKLGKISPCLTGELDMTFAKTALTNIRTNQMLIKGVQIDRFVLKIEQNQISQGEIEFVNIDIFKTIGSSKKIEDASKKRIALQGLTGINEKFRLKATIVPKDNYLANSCNYLLETTNCSLQNLLAWFNSKLLNFIFKTRSTSSNVNGYEVDNLPIICDVIDFSLIVKQILALKKENPEADTSKLEAEIDQMVYKLYNLTTEEIEIIENSVK